jgi:hypothetical protein
MSSINDLPLRCSNDIDTQAQQQPDDSNDSTSKELDVERTNVQSAGSQQGGWQLSSDVQQDASSSTGSNSSSNNGSNQQPGANAGTMSKAGVNTCWDIKRKIQRLWLSLPRLRTAAVQFARQESEFQRWHTDQAGCAAVVACGITVCAGCTPTDCMHLRQLR